MSEVISSLSILQIIDENIKRVDDAMVKRIGSKFDPTTNGEVTIGTFQDPIAKRLYCILNPLRAEVAGIVAQASYTSSDVEEQIAIEKAYQLSNVADLCQKLFWAQLHHEMNTSTFETGLRRDWMVVKLKARDPLWRVLGIE